MTGRASTVSPEILDYLPGNTAAEKRSLAKWYAAARAALARNRPLTTAAAPTSAGSRASDLSAAEAAALRSVGAFKDETPIQVDNDPLIRSQAQYMALLEESLSAAEAAKLLTVIAYVSLRPDTHAQSAELIAHCRTLLAGYKCPREVRVLSELPKTVTGKIQRNVLRERTASGS
jgi:acyl-CoA synthetase (AMP-forming)/AMP-acid ligase II